MEPLQAGSCVEGGWRETQPGGREICQRSHPEVNKGGEVPDLKLWRCRQDLVLTGGWE